MLFNKSNVAGVVVLYNSEAEVILNLKTYSTQVDHLFVIDNSEIVDLKITQTIRLLPNITYIGNSRNMGIAYALNQGANMAIAAGYYFLLTMDDDTLLPDEGIKNMLTYINECDSEKVGIVAGQSDSRLFKNTIESVPYTITSGNLLNLSAYQNCGPFMDTLFIDFVDHEYCFRLSRNKYKIVEINSIRLVHKLGYKKQLMVSKYSFPFYWVSHSPLRIYYKTRNCIFVLNKYSFVSIRVRFIFYKEILKDLLKIIFLEDCKRSRIAFFIMAVIDAFRGKLGENTIAVYNA